MPAPATTTELLDALARSGLLSPRVLDGYAPRLAAAGGPAAALRLLLDEHAVTPFQARYLADGRYKGFFLGGKYKLLAHLGSGGVGEVYLGEQLPLHRLVAIKFLKLAADSPEAAGATQRFFREARAAAALRHPNIAQLYDVSHAAPTPYMVLEHIDGTNLHAVVAEGRRLSVARAVDYAVQAARGLEHAHRGGLVHRDVKPGNLVLDRAGVVRLLDLGLARYHTDAAKNEGLTAKYDHDNLIGTADYMAPEQTRDSSAVDARADVYSLGCTLYYLLTGQAPFHGGSVSQKLLWHQTTPPTPAGELRPDLPPALVAVLARMMAKDRAARYPSAADAGAALGPWHDAAVGPPPAREMPEWKADQYRLGLVDAAPPPDGTPPPAEPPAAPVAAPSSGWPPWPTWPPKPTRRLAGFLAIQATLLGLTAVATTYLNRLSGRGLTTEPVRRSLTPDAPKETLQVAGPASAAPLLTRWAAAYQLATGTGVKYEAVGPDAAAAGLRASSYDVALADGPPAPPLAGVPLTLRAAAPVWAAYDAGMEDKGRLILTRNFLRWCMTDGQARAAEFGATPLPPGVALDAARNLADAGTPP